MSEEKKTTIAPAFELKDHKKDVDFILSRGEIRGDTLHLNQGDTEEFFKEHGVGRDDLERFHHVVNRFDTAASVAATTVLKQNIEAALKEGKEDEAAKLKGRFSARTVAFSHEAVVSATKDVNAGPPKAGEKAERKTTYGHIRVGMEVRGKLDETLKEQVATNTRKFLGIKD